MVNLQLQVVQLCLDTESQPRQLRIDLIKEKLRKLASNKVFQALISMSRDAIPKPIINYEVFLEFTFTATPL